MSEHPNVALLRSGYAAFATGDMATLDALFADDVVWHVAGRNRLAGAYKGRNGSSAGSSAVWPSTAATRSPSMSTSSSPTTSTRPRW